MGRRVILLVAAAMVAAIGAGLVFVYATGNSAAYASTAMISVFRAKDTIQPGTPGSDLGINAIETTEVPAEAVPAGSITNFEDIASQKAVTTIFGGQVLIAAQFGANNTTGGLPIPAGKMAVAVALGDPQRVAGFVQPGSRVAVFATKDNKTEMILNGVTVIAVGPSTMTTQTTIAGGATTSTDQAQAPLTLALSQAEATALVNATNGGQVYLGLLGS